MSIQYLSDANFSAPGGRSLRINLGGLVFVMFMSSNCPHCRTMQPIFQNLSKSELRVKFALANVGQFKRIAGLSQSTNTPIKFVPMMILYSNGRPHARYKGKQDPQSILSFLNKMVTDLGGGRNDTFIKQPNYPSQQPNQVLPGGVRITETDRRRQEQMDPKFVAENEIPYNAPYMKYKPMDINYQQ